MTMEKDLKEIGSSILGVFWKPVPEKTTAVVPVVAVPSVSVPKEAPVELPSELNATEVRACVDKIEAYVFDQRTLGFEFITTMNSLKAYIPDDTTRMKAVKDMLAKKYPDVNLAEVFSKLESVSLSIVIASFKEDIKARRIEQLQPLRDQVEEKQKQIEAIKSQIEELKTSLFFKENYLTAANDQSDELKKIVKLEELAIEKAENNFAAACEQVRNTLKTISDGINHL